jgi:hypothetical protein
VFLFFQKNFCAESPWHGRRQRLFFFFLKKTYAESPRQRPSAKTVFYFKKNFAKGPCNYARKSWEHPSCADFSQSCRASLPNALGKGPFADGPLGKEATFCFFPH